MTREQEMRDKALAQAKALGRLAEEFIVAAPANGMKRRAERDRAVQTMRDGEKVLIEMVETLRAAALAAPPPDETRPDVAAFQRQVDRWSATHSSNSHRTRDLMYRLLDALKAAQAPPPDPPGSGWDLVEWLEYQCADETPCGSCRYCECARALARQSAPLGLVAVVRELCTSFEHTLRHRHSQAHNGDVYAAGAYEVCQFCAPARDLIEQTLAALPATDPQEAK